MSTDVSNNPAAGRYEIRVDGRLGGFAAYDVSADTLIFTHAEVEPALEGQGVGSELARGALDDARRQGRSVVPRCPFIAAYVRRHQEYADLVESTDG